MARISRSSVDRLTAQARCPTGAAAQGQRNRLQYLVQAAGPPPVPGGQARYLPGERRPGAFRVSAEETADLQVD